MDKTETMPESSGHHEFLVAGWQVDPATLRMTRGEQTVKLEPRVMQVLVFLVQKPGEVVPREELEATVWKGRVVGYDAVANTIIKLRKAFGDDSRQPHVIETISKTGYRLIAEVTLPTREIDTPRADANETRTTVRLPGPKYRLFIWATLGLLVLIAVAVAWNRQASHIPSPLIGQDVSALSKLPSIAVLPFENISSDEAQQYFSDGITEDLITDLSKIPGLLVVARNSVFAYKNSGEAEQTIGRDLGARYLLKGSVRRELDRVRINVRLVDADQGRNLWAERFDRKLTSLFEIQDQLANRIVNALKLELEPQVEDRLERSYVTSIEAYDEFLRGVDYYGRRSRQDIESAKAHFQTAIDLDPAFARAYSGLALAQTRVLSDGLGNSELTVLTVLAEAEQLVEQALTVDDSVPEIYFVKSQVEMYQGNLKEALRTIEHAIDLKPSYADGYGMMAWILHFAGRPKEGLKVMEIAERLNPRIPSVYRLVRGSNLYAAEAYDKAVKVLESASEISPHHPLIRLWLAAAYAASDRASDAEWQVEELTAQNPSVSLSYIKTIFPFKDPMYLARFTGHLRKAGLAD